MVDNQAGCLPSLLPMVREFLIQEGFEPSALRFKEQSFSYDYWELGGITPRGQFYLIPFKTNEFTPLNPADPNFFDQIKEKLAFPTRNEQYGSYWTNGRWHPELRKTDV